MLSTNRGIRRSRTLLAAAAGSALLALAPAGVAHAAPKPSCSGKDSSQVFSPWGDSGYYSLVAGGDFEASRNNGWYLSGAKQVAGSEPYAVTGSLGRYSLALPSGSWALSPAVCVNRKRPTFRFFVRNAGDGAAALRVDVYFLDSDGNPVSLNVGTLSATSEWAPSPILSNQVDLVETDGEDKLVRYLFRPVGSSASFQIDDVHVDPYRRT